MSFSEHIDRMLGSKETEPLGSEDVERLVQICINTKDVPIFIKTTALLAQRNLRIIPYVMKRLSINGLPIKFDDETFQECAEVLVKSVRNYCSEEKNGSLGNYLYQSIKNHLCRYQYGEMHTSDHFIKLQKKYNAYLKTYRDVNKRIPALKEVMDALHVSRSTAIALISSSVRKMVSLSELIDQEFPDAPSFEEELLDNLSARQIIDNAVPEMSELDKTIMRMYFGLGKDPPMSIAEISRAIGKSTYFVKSHKDKCIKIMQKIAIKDT